MIVKVFAHEWRRDQLGAAGRWLCRHGFHRWTPYLQGCCGWRRHCERLGCEEAEYRR